MADKAASHGLLFRPHFKTHQSADVSEWFRDAGVRAITVSSLQMAAYFARHRWDDITIASLFNPAWTVEINSFAEFTTLNLLVDRQDTFSAIADVLEHTHHFFIKVDNGYGRAGISSGDSASVLGLAQLIDSHPRHRFAGILIHQGDNYKITDTAALAEAHRRNLVRLKPLVAEMKAHFPEAICSWGDTPSCVVADDFSIVDEIRPGNFVFFDVMQLSAGICNPGEIALTLLAPVVGVYPAEGRMILNAGAVHLSKERITGRGIYDGYGLVATIHGAARGEILFDLAVSDLWQEHARVTGPPELIATFRPGDVVGIIPVHSCLTADLMKGYLLPTGEHLPMMSSSPLKRC